MYTNMATQYLDLEEASNENTTGDVILLTTAPKGKLDAYVNY